jgi:HPt (histidine-containing phosphotransfer) domain-containing protein
MPSEGPRGAELGDDAEPDSGLYTAHVDIAALDELRILVEGDPEKLASFIDEILPGLVEAVDLVDAACERGERQAIRSTAHTLKSVAGTLGARGLVELSKELESRAEAIEEDGLQAKRKALHDALTGYLSALADLRKLEGW